MNQTHSLPSKKVILLIRFLKNIGAGALLFLISSSASNPKRTKDITVPEGYEVEVAASSDLVDYPMFATLDENGRLFVFESVGNVYNKTQEAIDHPQFRIKLLEDVNGDGVYDKSTVFADKVGFPQGGVFYKGSLYASSAPDLLKLTDTDGDGVADKREVLLTGWTLNVNANSLVGPFIGPDGKLYLTSAIMGFDVTSKEGKRMKGETARIWRLNPDGTKLEWISAGGMNNPVELTFTEAGEPIGTETYFTDPKAGQRDALVYWTEGGVYPKPNKNIDRDSLVRTGDLMPVVSKYSRVAPAGICRYRSTVFGEDFKDNLFSAQFNTHKILRHKVFRDGASFRTEDEVFFFADNEDSHPTDVLEDADGSLLIVETGGWFIKGCPLSQVSKPELKGAIYRVRKKGANRDSDPYGRTINWTSLSVAEAAQKLADPRSFVQDRSVEFLVKEGERSIPVLVNLLQKSKSSATRTKATFALYRIGSEKAQAGVRLALADTSQQVVIAAARAVGLAGDKKAASRLQELVGRKGKPAVSRQAATALGQLGMATSVPALLAATGTTDDRFLRHALIYALVSINQPALTRKGLAAQSPRVVDAALIALDQMPASDLKAVQVIDFLSHKSTVIQKTALWVIAHHPEWAGEVKTYLVNRFRKGALTVNEQDAFRSILVAFSMDSGIQQFIAEQMKGSSGENKLFLMSVMAGSQLKSIPVLWTEQLKGVLGSTSTVPVKTKALELVRLYGIKSLSTDLKALADASENPTVLRVEALSTFLETNPQLSAKHFDYLYGQLGGKSDATIRLRVATTLSQAELSEEQLLKVAKEYMPKADPFILPRLLPVFKGRHSVETGEALVKALISSATLDSYTEEGLWKLFAEYPDSVKPEIERLVIQLNKVQAERLKYLQALEANIAIGVLENGRKLFFGKAVCSSCHTVGPDGGKLGPDLTSIQLDRSAHDLLEAIAYPSASFVREFETYKIKTKNGDYTGIIHEKSPDAIVLNTSPQTSVRIARSDISSMEISDVSMMPQGLDKILTSQEMADLMVFLLGQDQDPKTDKAFLR